MRSKILAVAWLPLTALAQQPLELDPVTVEGELQPAPAAHRDVLDARQLETTPATTIDDLLRQIPAFSLFRRSSGQVANPTTQGVTLRGIAPSGASRSLVLLDGMPLNDPFGGWVVWQRVPMLSLASAEVTRGGVSSQWGSAALAGLIQLRTAEEAPTRLQSSYGSQDTWDARAHFLGGDHNGSLQLGADWRESSGYPVLAEDQRGGIDTAADAEHRQVWARMRGGSEGQAWTLAGGAFQEERDNGTRLTGNSTDIRWASLGLDWAVDGGQAEWLLYGQDQRYESLFSAQAENRQSETPALDQFAVPAQALGSSLSWNRGPLTLGFDLRAVEGETRERYFFSEGDFQRERRAGAEQQFAGAWVQSVYQNAGWVWTQAVRVDWWSIQNARRVETDRNDGSVLLDERPADRDGWEWSPRIDGVRQLDANSRLRIAAWQSFRVPTINELVRPFRVRNDITAANSELKVEELTGVDLGWDGLWGPWQLSLTGFWSELEDAVANLTVGEGPGQVAPCGFVPSGGVCRQRQNLDKIRSLGVESSALWPVAPAWTVRLGLLYAEHTVRRGPEALRGKAVAQSPDWRGSLRLDYSAAFDAGLWVQYEDSRFEDDLNQRRLKACTTLGAALGQTLGDGVSLRLIGENLLDEECPTGLSGDGLESIGAPRQWLLRLEWTPGAE